MSDPLVGVRVPKWALDEIDAIRGRSLRCTSLRGLLYEALEARAKKSGKPWPPAKKEER